MSEDFLRMVEEVRGLDRGDDELREEDLLDLYKWYKQATVGDCNRERPTGILNYKEQAKWDAWDGVRGTSKAEAEGRYIAKAASLMGS